MAKRQSMKQEVVSALRDRKGFDRSKHEDKIADKQYIESLGTAPLDRADLLEKNFFYTRKTFEECVKKGVDMMNFCKEKYGHRVPFSSISEQDIIDYLHERKALAEAGQLTARTLAKEKSQLSKTFKLDLVNKFQLLPCTAESDKGRGADPCWNPDNHKEQLDFYRMTGARKGEYKLLNASEIRHYGAFIKEKYKEHGIELKPDMHGRVFNLIPNFSKDGTRVVQVMVVHAKHGKTNVSKILPEHQERLAEIFKNQEYLKWLNPSDHCNVHACRREYAQNLYQHFARNVLELPHEELYRCRDGSGRVYDRQAVSIVARSLGHAKNDLFDTIHNYLR